MKRAARAFFSNREARECIIFLFFSFMNLFYSIYNFFIGIAFDAPFAIAVALYYFIVMLVRVRLIHTHKDVPYAPSLRLSAYLIALLSFAMSLIIIYTVTVRKEASYSTLSITVLSVYSVYSIARAFTGFFGLRASGVTRRFLICGLRISLALPALFNLLFALSIKYDALMNFSVPIGAVFSAAHLVVSVILVSVAHNKP